MPPPPPRGAPPAPMGGAPTISSSALAAIRKKVAEPAKISRAEVEANDESFRAEDEYETEEGRYGAEYEREDRYRDEKYDDDRDRDRDREDDMADGDGYGDGYGAHRNEYDDSYGEDDRAFDYRASLGGAEERDDSYLNEVQDEEEDDIRRAPPKNSSYRVGDADRREESQSTYDPRSFTAPFDYPPNRRIPQFEDAPEIFNFRPILKATYRELRNFVLSPIEPGKVVRCYIERNRSGSNMMSPFYSLCADLEDGTGRELMVCKKVFYSFQSHHIFSLKGEDLYRKREQRSRLYLGKLRAVADRSQYILYDNGNVNPPDEADDKHVVGSGEDPEYKPDKYMPGMMDPEEFKLLGIKSGAKDDAASLYRKELCVIVYNTKKRPAPAGVRGTEIAIPSTFLNANTQAYMKANSHLFADAKNSGKAGVGLPTNTVPNISNASLSAAFSRSRAAGKQNVKQTKHVFVIHERTSKYDPLSSCLVDFKSRANIASTKNAQYIESSAQNDGETAETEYNKDFILQIGKTAEDCFNLDVKYPLSLLQAFAISVSRMDAKMSW